MIVLLVFMLVVVFFTWLIIYSAVMPKRMRKKGRQVDVRVVSCEAATLSFRGTERTGTYYKITVDFSGLNGETIVKSIDSEKPYTVGDYVRSLYMDQKDSFLFDEAKPVTRVKGDVKITVIVIILMLLVGISVIGMIITENEVFSYGIGYCVGLAFAIYGISEIIAHKKRSQQKSECEVIMGTQVSCIKERNNDNNGYIYHPIYEYTLNGETYTYESSVGSSGACNKNGRQVHMERNTKTGEIRCREDDKISIKLVCLSTLVGVIILGGMVYFTIFGL